MENQPMATCKKCLHTEDELMAKSWAITKQNWWHLLKLILFPILVGVVYALVSFILGWIGVALDNSVVSTIMGVLVGILSFMFSLYMIWAMFAMAYGVFYLEDKLSLWQIYTRVLGKIFPLIWIYIIFIALIIPGYLLFIVPGVIMLVWFSMSFYVCLDDGTWGVAALWKSKELVKGLWWSVVARYMVVSVLMIIVIYTTVYVLGVAGLLLGLLTSLLGSVGAIVMAVAAFIGYIIYLLIVFALMLYFHVYFVQVYKSIKETKGDIVVKENKTLSVVIAVWAVIFIVVVPLILFIGPFALGGLFELLDTAGADNILRSLSSIY